MELGIILTYLVVATIICIPYQKWRAKRNRPARHDVAALHH